MDWAEQELPSSSGMKAERPEVAEWGVRFDHSLKVGSGNYSCCSVGKYHGLVVDASFDWKPAECAEEPQS